MLRFTIVARSGFVQFTYPGIKKTNKPHGANCHDFLLSWHDVFHAWRNGSNFKAWFRQLRVLHDEKLGFSDKQNAMSKAIWNLSDLDFSSGQIYRTYPEPLSAVLHFTDIIKNAGYSFTEPEDDNYLFAYTLSQVPGSWANPYGIDLENLGGVPDKNFFILKTQVDHIRNYLRLHLLKLKTYIRVYPNASIVMVILSDLLTPKCNEDESLLFFLNNEDFKNFFYWSANTGLYFKKEYRQELEELGIKPKLRENSPVLIRSALKYLAFTKLNNSIMISKLSSQFKIDFTWKPLEAGEYLKKNPEITYVIHSIWFDCFAISSLNSERQPEAKRFYSNSEFLSILLEIQKKDCKDILKNIQEYKFGKQEYFDDKIKLIEQQQDSDKLSIIKQALEDTLKSVRLINVVNITKYWKLNIGISIAIAAVLVTLSIFFPPIGFFLAGVTITNTIIGIIGSLAFLGSFLICTAISAIVQNNQKIIDGNALLEEKNELRKNTTSYDGSIAKIFTSAPSTNIHDTHGSTDASESTIIPAPHRSTDALKSTIIPGHTGNEKEEKEEENIGSSPKPPHKTI